jgi:hypothetical protein
MLFAKLGLVLIPIKAYAIFRAAKSWGCFGGRCEMEDEAETYCLNWSSSEEFSFESDFDSVEMTAPSYTSMRMIM